MREAEYKGRDNSHRLPSEDTLNVAELPEYSKIPQVAEVLGLSTASVWRLIWRGDLPSVRVSERSVRVSREALAGYLAGRPTAVAR
jgi:excisionase family DNA binding protein